MNGDNNLLSASIDYSAFPERIYRSRIRTAFHDGGLRKSIETYGDLIEYINGQWHEEIEPAIMRILGIGKNSAGFIARDLKRKGLLKHITPQEYD